MSERDRSLPLLPRLLDRKIYKTGQTRGADDDVIYQNRVSRASTVLIPYACWDACREPQDGSAQYENGFIVLIAPSEYFGQPCIDRTLAKSGLALAVNALVFYETRADWNRNNPTALAWQPANERRSPLGGQYVARIPGTTATTQGEKIVRGFATSIKKGAGIRVYEYASNATIEKCRLQLEALFWLCSDSEAVAVANGMTKTDCTARKSAVLAKSKDSSLLDFGLLAQTRIVNREGQCICPLCLEKLSGEGFFARMEQAEGRLVPDLTVTEVNLFHVDELRIGALNHRPYNVGWGHHHCNVVVRDSGIGKTLAWMRDVLHRNDEQGLSHVENRLR